MKLGVPIDGILFAVSSPLRIVAWLDYQFNYSKVIDMITTDIVIDKVKCNGPMPADLRLSKIEPATRHLNGLTLIS